MFFFRFSAGANQQPLAHLSPFFFFLAFLIVSVLFPPAQLSLSILGGFSMGRVRKLPSGNYSLSSICISQRS